MFDLTGKTALVTGATQGIGFAIASCLAAQGATVHIVGASSMEKCVRAAEKIPHAVPHQVNLAEADCAAKLYAQTGDVDIAVLNASVQIRKPWLEITDEEFDTQMHVNLKSSLKLIQKYAPHMQAQGWGRIVTVGSVQQVKPHKDMAVYAASKAGQMSLVLNLARQLAPDGITVNNISPGVIVTPRNDQALSDEAYNRQVIRAIPCGYTGAPLDCSGAVLLLCSEAGRYITGIDLLIDGGMHLE